jgi:hypothetical protein
MHGLSREAMTRLTDTEMQRVIGRKVLWTSWKMGYHLGKNDSRVTIPCKEDIFSLQPSYKMIPPATGLPSFSGTNLFISGI